jgi:hypothetical protein
MSIYESDNEKERMEDWQCAPLAIYCGPGWIQKINAIYTNKVLTTQKMFFSFYWAIGIIELCENCVYTKLKDITDV